MNRSPSKHRKPISRLQTPEIEIRGFSLLQVHPKLGGQLEQSLSLGGRIQTYQISNFSLPYSQQKLEQRKNLDPLKSRRKGSKMISATIRRIQRRQETFDDNFISQYINIMEKKYVYIWITTILIIIYLFIQTDTGALPLLPREMSADT
jgi:hypothetical protein